MSNKETFIIPYAKPLSPKVEPEYQHGGPQSGIPPAFIVGSGLAPYLIVGTDFGTNFCRLCTFADGKIYSLQPYVYSAFVEDLFKIPPDDAKLVHSVKTCIAEDYHVHYENSDHSAVDLAEKLFGAIKKTVEASTEKLLAKTVISVPACFNHRQREAVKLGAQTAGLEVLGLINDPTAAALHACYNESLKNGRYLVISCGSYSLEASVIEVAHKLIETKVVRGSKALSSQAATLAIADWIQEKFDVPVVDAVVLAEKLKKDLDFSAQPKLQIGDEFATIDRAEIRDALRNYNDGLYSFLDQLFETGATETDKIAGVILTGGGVTFWLIQEMLQRRFPNVRRINGNVSAGAALYAALLSRQTKDWVVWDALANPVFVERGKALVETIAANSPQPINGHVSLPVGKLGKINCIIHQAVVDSEDRLQPVAWVAISEKLEPAKKKDLIVDLATTVTADGMLSFSARHKVLDINLSVEVLPFPEQVNEVVDLRMYEPVKQEVAAGWGMHAPPSEKPMDTAAQAIEAAQKLADAVERANAAAQQIMSAVERAEAVVRKLQKMREPDDDDPDIKSKL